LTTPRRTQLDIARAVARVKNDSVDSLWPDPANLLDLPRNGKEMDELRRAVKRTRAPGGVAPCREGTVPKRDGLTRTGHQLNPVEWVYYQALVDSFLHRVESRMESREHVFGYRARYPRTAAKPFGKPMEQWLDFHRTVKDVARLGIYEAVVITDIAAFFEQVPHALLEDQLLLLGVPKAAAHELRQALAALMGGRERGLPQGCDASSVLGSMYLGAVDKTLLRAGHSYYRYADDIRIFAKTERQARRSLRLLESEVRRLGLNLQPGKTNVLVGAAQIKTGIIDVDAEVAGIDYFWRGPSRKIALRKVKEKWRSVSRRKAWPKRFVKFLINRLRIAKDPMAVNWCLGRLGVIDWLADLVAPYLAIFANRKQVQGAIEAHLTSDGNMSPWEAAALLRMCLSARRVRRGILDYAAACLGDRNHDVAVRQWSAVLLGKAGDASDHRLVASHHIDDVFLARATVVALQSDPSLRGAAYADIISRFPDLKPLANRYRGLAKEQWPDYPVW
jgi:hypothetical protein